MIGILIWFIDFKKDSKELSKIIANYLELGMDEAKSLIPILNKDGINNILNSMGFEKKEIKKLIKTI